MDLTKTEPYALKLLFERTDALNGIWNLYIAVCLGFLGILASGKPFTQTGKFKVLMSTAFAVFAFSNWWGMYDLNLQRSSLYTVVASKESDYKEAAEHARPSSAWLVTTYHLTLDLSMMAAIGLVKWHQTGTKKAD
jgi:hypothetical protein